MLVLSQATARSAATEMSYRGQSNFSTPWGPIQGHFLALKLFPMDDEKSGIVQTIKIKDVWPSPAETSVITQTLTQIRLLFDNFRRNSID